MMVLRNMVFNFRKYAGPLALSLLGVVLAFCAFVTTVTQIRFEKGFDRFHPHPDCLFRVDMPDNNTVFRSVLPPGFADAVINSSAHVVAGTLVNPFLGDVYLTLASDGVVHSFKEPANIVSPDFFRVFEMEIVEGDPDVLKHKDMLAIPESMARKFFGRETAVGKIMKIKSGAGFVSSDSWIVGAVYRDMPANSQIRNEIYMAIPDFFMQNFTQSNFVCYLRLDSPENTEAVEDAFNSSFDFSKYSQLTPVSLLPMSDIYFQEEKSDGRIFRSGSRTQMYVLGIIAFMVILAAFMNFTNLYAALIPSRLKSLNTRMVLGAGASAIRAGIMAETTCFMFSGALISLFLSMPLTDYLYEEGIAGAAFSIAGNPAVVLMTLGVAVLAGVLAGLYPAFFATSFTPALVLKGNFSLTSSGRRVKECLVVLQYVISFTLLALVSVVYMQNRMMSNVNTRFDSDMLAVMELPPELVRSSYAELEAGLKELPEVEGVAFASEIIGSQDVYSTQEIEHEGVGISTFLIPVSPDFLKVTGIGVVDGRDFAPEEYNRIIMNRYAMENYGIAAGEKLDGGSEVLGICEDIALTSMRKEQSPLCFVSMPGGSGFFSAVYVRLRAGFDAVSSVADIRKAVSDVDPEISADVLFYDGIISEQYRREQSFGKVVLGFSVLAVVLSLIGVFSMVVFDVRLRTREITLRKIFGADYGDVIWLGNKPYFFMVLTGFMISLPVAWLAASRYLDGFVYRVGIPVWVFPLLFVLMEAITALLVLWRFHVIASQNPADSLDLDGA